MNLIRKWINLELWEFLRTITILKSSSNNVILHSKTLEANNQDEVLVGAERDFSIRTITNSQKKRFEHIQHMISDNFDEEDEPTQELLFNNVELADSVVDNNHGLNSMYFKNWLNKDDNNIRDSDYSLDEYKMQDSSFDSSRMTLNPQNSTPLVDSSLIKGANFI